MRLLSLFSGIGAFEKALSNLGVKYELVGFSEIDKYAIQSYCAIHSINESLNLGDVSKIENEKLPATDLITYGFPCQDISVAGLQKGIKQGTRSGLLYEAERIIEHVKPKYAIAENVKNLVGKKHKNDFEELLKRLEGYGYNNYWKILNAKDFGIPQNRERVFIVSIRKDIDNETFEFPKPTELTTRLKDMLDSEFEDKYIIDNDKSGELLKILYDKGLLSGDKFCTDSSINDPIKRDVSNCITARYDAGIQNQKSIGLVVVEPKLDMVGKLNMKGNDQIKRVYSQNGLCPTITTMGGGNTEPKVLVKEATKKGYDIAKEEEDSINISFLNSKTRRGRAGKGVAQTLDTQCNQAVLQNHKIRKLTPLECWRLMGFTDNDYWAARTRLEETFYNGGDRSNSQMYKQAGNSICVNVLEAIFKELVRGVKC